MIARVTLDLTLRKEFDYLIPEEFSSQVEVGTRVKVPFGTRQVLGSVTALVQESPHTNLKPILKVIGRQALLTPKVLQLARWIAEYYCCPLEVALKSVLPDSIRKEQEGWRERLLVRPAHFHGDVPKLSKRQQEVWNVIEEWKEIPLQKLLELTETTPVTVRRLEDKGLITITSEVSERDPYANETILPTKPLTLNAEQAKALQEILEATGSTRVPRVSPGVSPPADGEAVLSFLPITELTIRQRRLPHFEIPGHIYHITWRTHNNLTLSPEAQRKTREACTFWHGKKMHCYIACVMPDHVHLLVQPLPVQKPGETGVHSLSEILHSIKSFSAHEVNKVMWRSGPVWNDESYDRIIRSEADLHEKWNYIWNNPRELGLVGPLEEYPFIWAPSTTDAQTLRRDDATHPPEADATHARTFLLHGVTGSGKTEIYLQAIAQTLEQGKGAIVLVPEISLTPQTVERFKARFSSGPLRTLVAVLHSHLSAGERHDEWHKIRQGRARIVIGARSAIFAPVDPLGLIIVDEEHEHSYKQEEAPRYHARDVAVKRGQLEGAIAVLGSATPSLESFHNAQKGKYQLLQMLARADDKKMPLVRVVDMRSEARKGKGIPIFSQVLHSAIASRLDRKEQTMLFLNRRGYAASLQCPLCGYVAGCPNCSIALTYHRKIEKLCCHICGHRELVPAVCPQQTCRNPAIRYAGLGTERVEDTLAKLFPKAEVRRMDSDALKRKEDYRRILGDFRKGKIDILVGTQMIAKGLHFPNVTLVGIIYADLSLHMPDFRAGERTFQLLTQVAGRAGRGDVEGEVIVQAFTPFHPAIQYARRHDFAGFYEQELEFRQQLKYPPFTRAAMLTLKGRNEDKVRLSAEYVKEQLEKVLGPLKDLILAGPAPSPLLRAQSLYRYQIMLRTRQMTRLSHVLAKLHSEVKLPDDVSLTVDVDPVNLF